MKKWTLALLALLTIHASADRVGNGGGLWVCEVLTDDFGTYSYRGEFVDLFEAKAEFGLELIENQKSKTPEEFFTERKTYIKTFYPELIAEIEKFEPTVFANMVYTNGELEVVHDYTRRVTPNPEDCWDYSIRGYKIEGEYSYKQLANFTEDGNLLIKKSYLEFTPTIDKAAMLFHEVIYYWLRETKKDDSSDRTRKIVGHIFSTLPPEKMRAKIEALLAN